MLKHLLPVRNGNGGIVANIRSHFLNCQNVKI